MSGRDRLWVCVEAPASVANVACGFDTLGFAVDVAADRVAARRVEAPGVVIERIAAAAEVAGIRPDVALPSDPRRNTAGAAAQALLEAAFPDGDAPGVRLRIEKGVAVGSGLGSSAASAAAAALAVDAALGLGSPPERLLDAALAGEEVASGARHGDNVAPALFGGFQLVRLEAAPRTLSLPVPDRLRCALLVPDLATETGASRRTLPASVPLADAKAHWGHTAALVTGLFRGDLGIIASALEDRVAEPVRAPAVPGYAAVKEAARAAGALGAGLSGSGPTVFALCAEERAAAVARAMADAFEATGVAAEALVARVGVRGAHRLDSGADRLACAS